MNHTIISEDYYNLSKLTKDKIFTNHVNVFSILSDLSFPNKLKQKDIALEDIVFIKNKYGYFKSSIESNIHKLNNPIENLWDYDEDLFNDFYSDYSK